MSVAEMPDVAIEARQGLWVDADWDDLGPTLALIDEFCRAVRPRDRIELRIATGDLPEAAALERLVPRLGEINGLAARDGHLPEIGVHAGGPPADASVLGARSTQGLADAIADLRTLRSALAVAAAVMPVKDRAEWMAGWRPEPGFHPLVVDNASDDDTAELARAAGADVIVHPEPIERVANWESAAEHFLTRTAYQWLKWHFAGDELLPGAADLLQEAADAHPEARMIVTSYYVRRPDGTSTLWQDLDETRLLCPEEALALSAGHGNWFGPPSAQAIHREVVGELRFGTQPWVADWQASLLIASRHPVLYLAEPVAVFDTTSRKFFSAHERDVHSLVQELAMRHQSLARLRERAPDTPGLRQLTAMVDAHAVKALTERVVEAHARDAAPEPAAATQPQVAVAGERSPEPPVTGDADTGGPVIAVHAPRPHDPSGRDFMGYALEFAARYARYAYLPQLDGHPELLACRRRGDRPLAPGGLEILTNPAELNRLVDILVCLEGRPYVPEMAPPREFDGLKAYHAWEFVFHAPEANQALVTGGVDVVLGYCRHDEYSPFFRAMYPSFTGRTLAVPFGFGPRFAPTVPFGERDNRVIGLGSVNPVDDPLCPPGELDAYVAFHPEVRWTHGWRRTLLEHDEQLADILDARFPVFPETKDLSYDAVAALNRCTMFANDPGLMAFPPARTYEGPACGTVLVGEDSTVHRDLGFVHGETALLHRAGDVEDFARVVREAQAEPGHLAQVAEAGRRLVNERYTHAAVARTLHEQLCAVHAGRAAAR